MSNKSKMANKTKSPAKSKSANKTKSPAKSKSANKSKPATKSKSKSPAKSKSTLLLLVRHGTTGTTGKVLPGRKPGLHISKKGVEEVEATAKHIADKHPKAIVYCSPMERARETAAIISKALNGNPIKSSGSKTNKQKPIQFPALNECDFGSWTGKKLSDLRKLPDWKLVQSRPGSFTFPKGESFFDLQSRIVDGLNELATKHKGKTIVAVSHADPIKAALGYFLGVPIDLFQRIMISPASVSSILISPTDTSSLQAMILGVNATFN